MSFGSRTKGSRNEREIAKLLESWWAGVEPGAKFVRTPLSGGWSGADVRAGFQASGDLMTTAKWFPWVVEIKRRENWAWSTLLAGKQSPIWAWWAQAIKAADEMRKVPGLVFRKNRESWHLLLPSNEFGRCMGWDGLLFGATRVVFATRPLQPVLLRLDEVLSRDAADFALPETGSNVPAR